MEIMNQKNKAIDFEHHMFAPEVIDYVKTRTEYPIWQEGFGILCREGSLLPVGVPYTFPMHDPNLSLNMQQVITDLDEYRIPYMDWAGLTCAMLSTCDCIEGLAKDDAVRLAKITNDTIAAAVRRHPDYYKGTICLPMPYVDESLKELDRAVNELGLTYWHTHSNYGEKRLSDPEFEPVLAKCADLGVPFYLHPTNPTCDYLNDSGIAFSSAVFGFGADATKTSLNLIKNGVFDRYPNLRMILGHMGEFYPFCADRMSNRLNIYRSIDPTIKNERDIVDYFKNKNIFMTTSGIFDPEVVIFTIKEIGIDNILLGSDYPYEDFKAAIDFVKNLPISDEDKDKILYKNAEKYILK